jgi:hypothetical protein
MDILFVRYLGASATTQLTSSAKGMPHQRTLVLKTIGSKARHVRSRALPYARDEELAS